MRAPAVLGTLLVLGLAGCGQAGSSSADFTGEDRKVADTIADLAEAGQRREPAEICNRILAAELKQEIAAAGAECPDEMEKAIEDADGFELDVKDVRVTGLKAEADVESTDRGKDVTRTFSLVKENDQWRIQAFG
jgi:hypothetical protein